MTEDDFDQDMKSFVLPIIESWRLEELPWAIQQFIESLAARGIINTKQSTTPSSVDVWATRPDSSEIGQIIIDTQTPIQSPRVAVPDNIGDLDSLQQQEDTGERDNINPTGFTKKIAERLSDADNFWLLIFTLIVVALGLWWYILKDRIRWVVSKLSRKKSAFYLAVHDQLEVLDRIRWNLDPSSLNKRFVELCKLYNVFARYIAAPWGGDWEPIRIEDVLQINSVLNTNTRDLELAKLVALLNHLGESQTLAELAKAVQGSENMQYFTHQLRKSPRYKNLQMGVPLPSEISQTVTPHESILSDGEWVVPWADADTGTDGIEDAIVETEKTGNETRYDFEWDVTPSSAPETIESGTDLDSVLKAMQSRIEKIESNVALIKNSATSAFDYKLRYFYQIFSSLLPDVQLNPHIMKRYDFWFDMEVGDLPVVTQMDFENDQTYLIQSFIDHGILWRDTSSVFEKAIDGDWDSMLLIIDIIERSEIYTQLVEDIDNLKTQRG